ncbi:hypothetical protein BaRGS_00004126 [Batillaria attramentaria]|uniref:Uncharacterized protein n=1 Tax=Batillaria attramentaria TaxID=370345 RepID=A0ABD0LYM7_9CAEN
MPGERLSIEVKLSVGCLLVGSLLFTVAFAVPHWIEVKASQGEDEYAGLWKRCLANTPVPDAETCVNYDGTPDWIVGVQVEECVALVCMLVALSLSTVLLFKRRKIVSLGATLSALVGGAAGLAGAVVFHIKQVKEEGINSDNFAWAFYLNAAGDIMIGISGLGLLVHTIRLLRSRTEPYVSLQ